MYFPAFKRARGYQAPRILDATIAQGEFDQEAAARENALRQQTASNIFEGGKLYNQATGGDNLFANALRGGPPGGAAATGLDTTAQAMNTAMNVGDVAGTAQTASEALQAAELANQLKTGADVASTATTLNAAGTAATPGITAATTAATPAAAGGLGGALSSVMPGLGGAMLLYNLLSRR